MSFSRQRASTEVPLERAFVQYPGARLRRVNQYAYVILTLQLDMYIERLSAPPLTAVRFLGRERARPPALGPVQILKFVLSRRRNGLPKARELANLVDQASYFGAQ